MAGGRSVKGRAPKPDRSAKGTVSFQRRVASCCALSVLLLLAVGALAWWGPQTIGATGSATLARLGPVLAPAWLGGGALVASVAAGMGLYLYLTLIAGRRLRRDVERLRAGIRQLTTPDKEAPPLEFAFREFYACAADLADAAASVRKQQARLNDDATRDPLTGLPNRRTFIYSLAREAAFALRTGWPLSLIMVDLDHFKTLNDTYGHRAGDQVLQQTARRLASLVRESDVVARFGGEEFVIILPGTRIDQAVQVAQQLRNALRCDRLVVEGQHEVIVTASFGVAEIHECRLTDGEALVNSADTALYQAKADGRDTVVAAPPAVERTGHPHSSPEQEKAAEAPSKSGEKDVDLGVDRDTMALMGSTFSILQVIPDQHRVAHDVVQQVAAVLRCTQVSLLAVNEPQNDLVVLSSVGGAPDDTGHGEVDAELRQWFEDLRSAAQFSPPSSVEPTRIQRGDANRPVTVLRFPLVAYGTVFGVIDARVDAHDVVLSKRQRTILTALCAIGATALKNCDAYDRLENRWMGLIAALCHTIHSKDAYKQDHARRVSLVAFKLAKAMGQHDEDELQLIRIAGLVHDIGKIGLPSRMFEKRGRLRPSERKLLEQHCQIGAEILERVAHFGRLATVVRYHHEHYDGGGYPEGLSGADIPIQSRILAVADAYDAMTSDRSYRTALSHEEAVRRIREASGTQFDPAVVTAFMECFEPDADPDMHLPSDGSLAVARETRDQPVFRAYAGSQ